MHILETLTNKKISKVSLFLSFILTATLLFGCNTSLPTPVPTPEQAQLPVPNVESVMATELPAFTDMPLNKETPFSVDPESIIYNLKKRLRSTIKIYNKRINISSYIR